MKYQWLEGTNEQTCEDLSKELGCKVKSITKGGIITGYQEGIDHEGNKAQLPIIRKGVEIELENETSEILKKIDAKFTSLKREGGSDLRQELDDLKATVISMKADLTKLQVRTKKS